MASFAGDNNLGDLWFGATSQNGAHAEGWFANAKIARAQTSGDDPLTVQANILAALASLYPSVTLRRGLEISFNPKHSNWFGGSFHQPVYGTDLPVGADATLQATKLIHGYGGLASVNHPFGVKQNDGASSTGSSTQTALDTARHKLAVKLLKNKCYGADILEVGYHSRGKTGTVAKLEDHLALWDTLSRNGVFLTGNGVSDNHTGHVNGWSVDAGFNTFQTTLWAASTARPTCSPRCAPARPSAPRSSPTPASCGSPSKATRWAPSRSRPPPPASSPAPPPLSPPAASSRSSAAPSTTPAPPAPTPPPPSSPPSPPAPSPAPAAPPPPSTPPPPASSASTFWTPPWAAGSPSPTHLAAALHPTRRHPQRPPRPRHQHLIGIGAIGSSATTSRSSLVSLSERPITTDQDRRSRRRSGSLSMRVVPIKTRRGGILPWSPRPSPPRPPPRPARRSADSPARNERR